MARHDAHRILSLFLPAADVSHQLDWQPSADVYRTSNGWLLKFDLAGVRAQDIQLIAAGKTLTIRGVRRDCLLEEGCCQYRMEISYNQFERSIQLPQRLEGAVITTEHRDGMLIVRISWEDGA